MSDLPRTVTTAAPASYREGVAADANSRGEKIFAGACASCHDWTGVSPVTGFATLTGVRAVNDPSATNVAQTVINGVNRKTTDGRIFMMVEVMPGVAIIARDTWSAFQAKDKLQVDWDLSEASRDSTSQFSAEARKQAANFPQKPDDNIGDVDKSFANAAKTVEAYYEYPFAAHGGRATSAPWPRWDHRANPR